MATNCMDKDELFAILNKWYVIDGVKMKIQNYVAGGSNVIMRDEHGTKHVIELGAVIDKCGCGKNDDFSSTSDKFLSDIGMNSGIIYYGGMQHTDGAKTHNDMDDTETFFKKLVEPTNLTNTFFVGGNATNNINNNYGNDVFNSESTSEMCGV